MMTKTNQPTKLMTKTKKITRQTSATALNDAVNAAIASKIIPTTPAPEVAARIKTKLMQRVQANRHEFVFAKQGKWKTLQDGIQIKLLRKVAGSKSFLLKMAANSSIAAHLHAQDEESFVLEGDITIEGIACTAGDYHYAHAGSKHQPLTTVAGCTLLIKSN